MHLQVDKPAGEKAALEAPFAAIALQLVTWRPPFPPVACLFPAAAAVGLAAEYAGEQVVEPAHLGALHLIDCLAALLDRPADCVRHAAGLVAVGAEPAAVALGASGLGTARPAAVEDLPHAALAEPQAEKEQAPARPRSPGGGRNRPHSHGRGLSMCLCAACTAGLYGLVRLAAPELLLGCFSLLLSCSWATPKWLC